MIFLILYVDDILLEVNDVRLLSTVNILKDYEIGRLHYLKPPTLINF